MNYKAHRRSISNYQPDRSVNYKSIGLTLIGQTTLRCLRCGAHALISRRWHRSTKAMHYVYAVQEKERIDPSLLLCMSRLWQEAWAPFFHKKIVSLCQFPWNRWPGCSSFPLMSVYIFYSKVLNRFEPNQHYESLFLSDNKYRCLLCIEPVPWLVWIAFCLHSTWS
jgi:hypothetical protein